ncbi:fmn-binding split barrel-related [Trichoderma arundinaceum]|uniref:Fmn-binding split barrel-related n=1 Tax=Trichoderma arundinaceum TaxID=490622 RepID=A0A395NCY9_TRIAR|nr:fmn-binding split barrel-related [Trichoderma arundinaceum]
MKFLGVVAGLSGYATALELTAPLFGDTDGGSTSRIPTSYESAVMGRRALALTKLGTLSTVFPKSSSSASASDEADAAENRPEGLDGVPIGLMDYIADCEDEGNPTLLAIRIATSFKNVRAGSNITLSVEWTPPYPPSKRIPLMSRLSAYVPFMGHKDYNEGPAVAESEDGSSPPPPDTVPYSAANLPRFSLIGYLEPINPDIKEAVRLASCYTTKHTDAKYWLPGNPIHTSEWARLVVTQVYWIGGFGDRAYIGWIPIEEWKKVTKEEWQRIQLPGEKKGWSEWSVNEADAGEL